MTTTTHTAPATTRPARTWAGFWAARQERAQRRAIYRRTVSELSGLTNRELTDLGIGRGEIQSIARQAAFGTA